MAQNIYMILKAGSIESDGATPGIDIVMFGKQANVKGQYSSGTGLLHLILRGTNGNDTANRKK